jgi:hypothetical protein
MNMIKKQIDNPQFAHLLSLLPPVSLKFGPWIAGGCARKLFEQVEWKNGDVDVFFPGHYELQRWRQQFAQSWIAPSTSLAKFADDVTTQTVWFDPPLLAKEQHVAVPKNLDKVAYLKCDTENAVTYELHWRDPHSGDNISTQLQLINTRFSNSLDHLWKDFDFEVSRFAVDSQHVVASPGAIKDITNRTATLTSTKLKSSNLNMRVIKHHAYGFKIDAALLKHVMQQVCDGVVNFGENY